MAIEKIILKNKPEANSNGQYNYEEGQFRGILNQSNEFSDLYSTSHISETNNTNISNTPGYIYGENIVYFTNLKIEEPPGLEDYAESNAEHIDDDIHFYWLDDAIGGDDLKNASSYDDYVSFLGNSTRFFKASQNDDGQSFPASEVHGDNFIEFGIIGTAYNDWTYECGDQDVIDYEDNEVSYLYNCFRWNFPNIDDNQHKNGSWENSLNVQEFREYDILGSYYLVVLLRGKEYDLGYGVEDRPNSMTVFEIPKLYFYESLWDKTDVCLIWGGADSPSSCDSTHNFTNPTYYVEPFSDYYSEPGWIAKNLAIKIDYSGGNISSADGDYYNYIDVDTEPYLFSPLNPFTTYEHFDPNGNRIDNQSDVVDFRPIPFVENIDGNYDFQNYYERNANGYSETTAPNTVKLSLRLAENSDSFSINYLTSSDISTFKFKGFVVNWNWKEGDPENLDEIQFPNSISGIMQNQNSDDTYYYVDFEEQSNTFYEMISDDLTHFYQTSGIKIIQAVVFSYLENPNNDGTIQAIRWKLVKIKINLSLDNVYIEDFADVGGFEFKTIPFPYTTPIVGGISDKSVYIKSINSLNKVNNFAEYEYVDKLMVENSKNNYELGKYFGETDLSQVRYFNNGSYDLNYLLNIQDTAFLSDGSVYYNPRNDVYWDGIINKFSEESCVGKIFIDDEMDNNLKSDCKFEFNYGFRDGDTIRDSSGNGNVGILIGDYELRKDSKETPLFRDTNMEVPETSTDDLAF